MELQLAALTAKVGDLLDEIRALRRENAELRRQVDLARGVQSHQPYALTPILPLPTPAFSPVHPLPGSRGRTAGEVTPGAIATVDGQDVLMPSPAADPEAKRTRRSLAAELDDSGGQPNP